MPNTMSKFEKAKKRLLSEPKDYTFTEAKSFLQSLGFEQKNKGKTSGSRVGFYRESDGATILLHKPHPEDILREYAVRQLIDNLKEIGEL